MEEQISKTRQAIEDARQAMIKLNKQLHRSGVDVYIDFDEIFQSLVFQDGYTMCAEHYMTKRAADETG